MQNIVWELLLKKIWIIKDNIKRFRQVRTLTSKLNICLHWVAKGLKAEVSQVVNLPQEERQRTGPLHLGLGDGASICTFHRRGHQAPHRRKNAARAAQRWHEAASGFDGRESDGGGVGRRGDHTEDGVAGGVCAGGEKLTSRQSGDNRRFEPWYGL